MITKQTKNTPCGVFFFVKTHYYRPIRNRLPKFADYQLSALDKANTRIPPKIFIFRDTEAPFTATESSSDFPTDESLKWRLYTRKIRPKLFFETYLVGESRLPLDIIHPYP